MPQYIIWICCIIIMPLPLTIALAVSHWHRRTWKHNAETHRQMQEWFPYTIFEEEMFAHCRSEIQQQNVRKTKRAGHKGSEFSLMGVYSLSPCYVLCVKGSVVVTSGDNIETSWTRARSTRSLMHAHNANNLPHNGGWGEKENCGRQGR